MSRRRPKKHGFLAAVVVVGIFYVACGEAEENPSPPCISATDCPTSHRCINDVCVPPGVDAGPFDAGGGESDAGGETDGGEMDASPADAAVDADVPLDAPMSGA